MFGRHSNGLKLSPVAMFVHVSAALLKRRCAQIADGRNSATALKERWFSGQDRPPAQDKFSENVRGQFRRMVESSEEFPARTYSYRPMTQVKAVIYEPLLQVLSGTGGGGTRDRPEVRSAFDAPDMIGIAIAPAPKDIGDELHRFVSFCWHLPDNDLCARGNATILCPEFPEYKGRGGTWAPTPKQNVNETLLKHFKGVDESLGERPERAVVFYAYAIMCSNAYMKEFEGALFRVADRDDPPRIPVAADPEICARVAERGRAIAVLERTDETVELPEDLKEKLTYFTEEFQLKRAPIRTEGGSSVGSIELFENNRVRISVGPVPKDILNFHVSGHNVLEQWLKLRTYRYSRTTFKREDYRELLELIQRIRLQLELVSDLDADLSDILTGETELLLP